jgi:hydroxymethylpyrimidine pyrophosphatase-like HAD family hydrolase
VALAAIGDRAEATYSSDSLLEISAAGVTKAAGVQRYCASRGVGQEAVLAFGDMPNDIPLLEWAGWGIAVENAHPEVRRRADEVTSANVDDGVAISLENLLDARGSGS